MTSLSDTTITRVAIMPALIVENVMIRRTTMLCHSVARREQSVLLSIVAYEGRIQAWHLVYLHIRVCMYMYVYVKAYVYMCVCVYLSIHVCCNHSLYTHSILAPQISMDELSHTHTGCDSIGDAGDDIPSGGEDLALLLDAGMCCTP